MMVGVIFNGYICFSLRFDCVRLFQEPQLTGW